MAVKKILREKLLAVAGLIARTYDGQGRAEEAQAERRAGG
jgi:hypothetical protein